MTEPGDASTGGTGKEKSDRKEIQLGRGGATEVGPNRRHRSSVKLAPFFVGADTPRAVGVRPAPAAERI